MFKELLLCVLAGVVFVEPRYIYNYCCSPVQQQLVQYRVIAAPQQVVYQQAVQPVIRLLQPALRVNPLIPAIETIQVKDGNIPDYTGSDEDEEETSKQEELTNQKAELEKQQAALAQRQAEVKKKLNDVKKKLASKKPVKPRWKIDTDDEEDEEDEEKPASRKDKKKKNEDEVEEPKEKPKKSTKPPKKATKKSQKPTQPPTKTGDDEEEEKEPEGKPKTPPTKVVDKEKEEKKKEGEKDKEEQAPSVPECAGGGFGPIDRQKIVNAHNLLRSEIARGDFVAKGKKMPAAKDMRRLEYDCELEKSAQEVSDTCVFAHSKGRDNVGENLYTASGTQDQIIAGKGVAASAAWAKEFQDYGWLDTTFTQAVFDSDVGHATQMAWAKSYKIGCGATLCKGNKMILVACHYKDAFVSSLSTLAFRGNMLDANNYTPVDTPTDVCTACPEGTTCDDTSKLCV